jgi:prepilin-type N-terminal cleavage/methylation domain-containing protein
MKNKKGFTLVELLAVIVVLAIIMIIAVPSVLDSMNSAKKSAFQIYAQKVLNTAETKYQTWILTGDTIYSCYNLTYLMGDSVGNYKGYVAITNQNTDSVTFKLTLTDNNYSYSAQDYSGLTTGNIKNAITISIPSGCKSS